MPKRQDPRELLGTTGAQRAAWRSSADGVRLQVDLVVVGGGLGGIATALAASRRGVSVAVVEQTHMLGGQATVSAVSAMDVTTYYDRSLREYGIWSEFMARVKRIYKDELRVPLNTARYKDDAFAPNVVVVERVLTEMLAEADVHCIRNAPLQRIERGASSVLVGAGGAEVRASYAIDATETGEVLRLAKVAYRLGNCIVPAAAMPPEGLDLVAIQDITLAAVIRRYDEGLPDWARVTVEPPGYRRYRPTISRSYPDSPGHQNQGPNGFAGYRATPDLLNPEPYDGLEWERITKTTLNFHNDQPVAASYLEDVEARAEGDRSATARTLSVLYYLQNELGLPWGVADDEGFSEGPIPRAVDPALEPFGAMLQHLPLLPYIRESRRLLGSVTLTGKSIFRRGHHQPAQWDVDAVAVGTYPPDLHGGRKPENLERDLDESLSDKPSIWREGPFPIPLGCLVPRDGGRILAAEKNISVSRIAAGAVRLHPTVFATGEAVGTLAALAVLSSMPVRDIPTVAVQRSLAAGGALLSPVYIRGLDRQQDRFTPVSIAVCRKLVDWTYVRSAGDQSPEPWIDVDLDQAEAVGRAYLEFSEQWSVRSLRERQQVVH